MDREFLSRISGFSAGPLVGRVAFILDFRLILCFCYAAMHCRYFAETKTLWEHLNSSADIFQIGAVETLNISMMSLLCCKHVDKHNNQVLTMLDNAWKGSLLDLAR